MLSSVLIANRGEIACRIIRAAHKLRMRAIAVYSEVDAEALHVRMADEAWPIGAAPASESYLRGERIIEAARASGAQAIHPGYGFLSENADFADACARAGIVFVGPPPAAIRAMGLKDGAKTLMQKAGVPVVPGYHGARQEPKFLKEKAYEIGYPVLIKAVAGGGGRGMRRVDAHADFEASLESAQREARSAFGNDHVLVEKYISAPRHIEMQIFADAQGHVVHLNERDCSLQRRHQKVIEEAPAPGMSDGLRALMGAAATEAARAVGYVGAGTVEFIADGAKGLREDAFYFMEMNTRLQVEHPVTEAITGLDLVEMQLRIAGGEPLPLFQEEVTIEGHAVEARLYAEDPENGFLPSTGKLWALELPTGAGIRVDAGVAAGGVVTPFYDPMIAKIIAHAPTRAEALDRLATALGQTVAAGPRTNVAFLKALCEAPGFRAGHFDTGFIESRSVALGATAQPPDAQAIAAGTLHLDDARRLPATHDAWSLGDAFQLGEHRRTAFSVTVSGRRLAVSRLEGSRDVRIPALGFDAAVPQMRIVDAGAACFVLRDGRQTEVAIVDALETDAENADEADGAVRAPMHGKLAALGVAVGDVVEKGQRLAVVEAMKMEHALLAPRAGRVTEIGGSVGAQVAQGARVVVIGDT